jgi:mono/diheme cytochrome c family protein
MKRQLLALAAVIATGSIGYVHAQTPAAGAVPTFTKDVAPIFYKNCVACHRPGEMAPMSLLSYESARPYARSIATKVNDGAMPPWHAESAPGVFKNDPRLNAREKATIVQWATNGAPQGDPKDLPPAPVFAEGWQIGKPDLILTMEKPYAVPAEGTIAYQNFTIPTNFTED